MIPAPAGKHSQPWAAFVLGCAITSQCGAQSNTLLEIPVSGVSRGYLSSRVVVSDTHVVVVVPQGSSDYATYATLIYPYAVNPNGVLKPLPSRKIDGEWRTAIALDGNRLFVGLPQSDTPGRHAPVEVTKRGSAPWSRDQTVVTAGVVREFSIEDNGVVDVQTFSSPEPATFQQFGARIAVSSDWIAAGAPSLDGKPYLYLLPRVSAGLRTVTLDDPAVVTPMSVALVPGGLIASEQRAGASGLVLYSLSDTNLTRLGQIPNPDPNVPLRFASEIHVSGSHLLTVSYSRSGGDGDLGKPIVDLFSRSDGVAWKWGKRLQLDSILGNYNIEKVAALGSTHAYTVSPSGIDEWSESRAQWTSSGQVSTASIAPGLQLNAIGAHSHTLALLFVQSASAEAATHLYLTIRNVAD